MKLNYLNHKNKLLVSKMEQLNFKNNKILLSFITKQGKIVPRHITGMNGYQQRKLTKFIRYARALKVLPYIFTNSIEK